MAGFSRPVTQIKPSAAYRVWFRPLHDSPAWSCLRVAILGAPFRLEVRDDPATGGVPPPIIVAVGAGADDVAADLAELPHPASSSAAAAIVAIRVARTTA